VDEQQALEAVGAKIRRLRAGAGLTLGALGDRAGLHPSYIAGIERGERNATLSTLIKLATGLDVELASLLDIVGEQELVEVRKRVRSRVQAVGATDLRAVLLLLDTLMEGRVRSPRA